MKFTNNGFELKSNDLFLKLGIVFSIMECCALYFFVPMLPEFEASALDIGATIFMCVWMGGVLCGAIYSFFKYSQKLFVREDGVSYTSIFGKRHLNWSEIKDYGLSYDGRANEGGYYYNSYILYFANEEQSNKNRFKKKLSKSALKITVSPVDYAQVLQNVIPFCQNQTDVEAFIPEDVPRFI